MENDFVILQCSNPTCGFRCPSNPDNFNFYCPLCGEKFSIIDVEYDNGYAQFACNNNYKATCLLDNVRSAYNVGNILRTASAFSIDHIYLCGYTPSPDQQKVAKTSLGAENHLKWSYHPNALSLVKDLLKIGYLVLSIDSSLGAKSLAQWRKPPAMDKLCFIVGNEIYGIDPEIRELSSAVLQLPVNGEKKSLNVSSAFAMAAFYFTTML